MELRQVFESVPDLVVVYVMAENQVNGKALRFIDGLGLRERIHFAVDPASQVIDQLGLRREDPEPMEQGVPHPATYVIDREGVIRFADVRTDFHIWVDSEFAREAIAALP